MTRVRYPEFADFPGYFVGSMSEKSHLNHRSKTNADSGPKPLRFGPISSTSRGKWQIGAEKTLLAHPFWLQTQNFHPNRSIRIIDLLDVIHLVWTPARLSSE